MKNDLTGPDPRLQVLLRIKEARQGISRQNLNKALAVEEQRRVAEGHAQDHHDLCTQTANDYVRNRFAAKGEIKDVGSFFQSMSLGNYSARRDASRASLVVERVSYRRTIATKDREDAATNYMAEMRTTEGLERFVQKQIDAANMRREIREDDDLHETHAARGEHGKA
ncbi:MAG: hypothetical protein ABJM43_19715 [Paracoccaceae bacterium]